MSYPRKVHTLIVEDEEGPRRAYTLLFERLVKDNPRGIANPTFAASFDDAARHLNGSAIFHMAIIDMGLPARNRGSVPDGIEPGMQLLDLGAAREHCPLPVVLVISGRLGGPTDVRQLREKLDRSFWHGQFLNKGDGKTNDAILRGIEKSQEYSDVGIHLVDAGPDVFPILSPREEDLLRRCCRRDSCLGVVLRWWSAETFEVREGIREWKKVLMGRFILDNNFGHSTPAFFKFEPAADAAYVHGAASVASKKLRHVKKVDASVSGSRSLLVTESVCTGIPLSLDDFLLRDSAEVQPALPGILDDVIKQLDQLGETQEIPRPVKDILWRYFQPEMIADAIARWMKPEVAAIADVPQTYEILKASTEPWWVHERQCNHGDLHSKNVAIDLEVHPYRAFIFDTGAMSVAIGIRDLALLEVTTLLFQQHPQGTSCQRAPKTSHL